MMKQRREAEGLTLRELAQETRITTPVIEALERGWSDRLPERAYLASMLPQLERRSGADAGGAGAGSSPCCGPSAAVELVAATLHARQHRCIHHLAGQCGLCSC